MIIDSPVISGSLAASFRNVAITGSLGVTGSITTTGTITAQTLIVQTITSSISRITGSTSFGSSSINNHNFTGSLVVSGAMFVSSSGNVGIGTISPDALLRIDSNVASTANNMLYLYNSDYTATTRTFIRVRNNITAGSTYSSYFGQGVDHKTYIIANDTSRNDIVINGDNGNVGIGTNSPAELLEVSGSLKIGNLKIQNVNGGSSSRYKSKYMCR
jgi:hypothetical protein